jgi:Zn-dependent oligopeptidase
MSSNEIPYTLFCPHLGGGYSAGYYALGQKTLDYNALIDAGQWWYDKNPPERFRKYILSVGNSVDKQSL